MRSGRRTGKAAIEVWSSRLSLLISFEPASVKLKLEVHTLAQLKYIHIYCMVFHMKTTLNISDNVMSQLKREAARQGRTMSELVEMALRLLFQNKKSRRDLPPLPEFSSGGHFVEIADRDALYQAMEGR